MSDALFEDERPPRRPGRRASPVFAPPIEKVTFTADELPQFACLGCGVLVWALPHVHRGGHNARNKIRLVDIDWELG